MTDNVNHTNSNCWWIDRYVVPLGKQPKELGHMTLKSEEWEMAINDRIKRLTGHKLHTEHRGMERATQKIP